PDLDPVIARNRCDNGCDSVEQEIDVVDRPVWHLQLKKARQLYRFEQGRQKLEIGRIEKGKQMIAFHANSWLCENGITQDRGPSSGAEFPLPIKRAMALFGFEQR